ncbi:MAG: NAD(P)/FAD-dependent oxidoreductase [Bacteroidales bacterium]|nr:NAD(P)/FAD-dependent oxidoreductase [Bacteroidales bacterium]
MQYDVIIIGGGLGGLTAGAKLAKEGKNILLLEQHDRPGGCATTFTRKDFTMEVGLHEMDGLHPADGKLKIFNELGVSDRVNFLPVPEFYRFFNGRTDVVMPHDKDDAIAMLNEIFPGEEAGIEAYFHRLMNAKRISVLERNKPDISIGKYLDSIFTDDEIKLVVLGNLGYFHDDPYSLSLQYFSMAESAYFHGRANFIQGGSQQLSDSLMNIIRENGGKVLLNHRVISVNVKNNRIESIHFINTMPGDHTAIECKAAAYVANAALPQIVELTGGDAGNQLEKAMEQQKIGASLLTVYFGFSRSLKALGHKYYSTFVFDESIRSMRDIRSNNRGGFDKRSFTFVDYSQVDSILAPDGKSVGAICCVDYIDDWARLDKKDYRNKKKEVESIFIERLNKLIPGCKDHIEHVETGTSSTIQRYTLNPEGAVYGFAQLPGRKPVDLSGILDNLHIASAWGKFGGGFSGAIFSGYMTALEMFRK